MASSLSLLSPCSNAASIGLHSSAHDAFRGFPYLVSSTNLRRRQLPQILSPTLGHGRHWKALAADTRVHAEGIDIERGRSGWVCGSQANELLSILGLVLCGQSSSSRRHALLAGGLLPALRFVFPAVSDATVTPAKIDLTTAPMHPFDAADGRLREAASVFQRALSAPTVEEEEKLWTEVIDKYGKLDAEWVPDIVSRAWGNRGNSRSRQGKMEEALEDFDRSIELAPYAVDPVLNRGVTLESLGRYDEAAADYQAVLAAQPNDPAAWNNLGNVKGALRQWDEALVNYRQAVQLAPEFSFAAANYALVLYQVGKENEAFKQFRSLLRKYPEFPDVRAALAVALYAQGLTAEAETNWGRMQDGRYRDREWVRNTRKWPPKLVNALEGFLDVKAVARS